MPLIREISVHGNYKTWGDVGNNGKACGTEVVYTAIPLHKDKVGWTIEEAGIVSLSLRFEIQKLIYADMQIRGIKVPDNANSVLHEYVTKLKALKTQVGGDTSWVEKQEQGDFDGSVKTE